MRTGILLFLLLRLIAACTHPADISSPPLVLSQDSTSYQERYRPAYHFSPKQTGMDRPAGLVYYAEEYHLFYRQQAQDSVSVAQDWAHEVSPDLVHWKQLPPPFPTAGDTVITSVSTVVDEKNRSGLCSTASCLIGINTFRTEGRQSRALVVSNDRGRTWQRCPEDVTLEEDRDLSSPKVFRYEPADCWIMVGALPSRHKVQFFRSSNLREWTPLSEFSPQGFADGTWEYPDIFSLPVLGTDVEKWVLILSHRRKAGSDMQYFIGNFDGTTFRNDNASDLILTLDEGLDNYAAMSWDHAPENRRLTIGWFNNWKYAHLIPTDPWRGSLTVARELVLRQYPEGVRLAMQPVSTLQKIRKARTHHENVQLREGDEFLSVENTQGPRLEIVAEFAYHPIETPTEAEQLAAEFGVKVFQGVAQETVIGYDVASQSLFVDRTRSGDTTFSDQFADRTIGLMPADSGVVKMHILVDHSSVEVFGNDGYIVMSNRVFPDPEKDQVEVYSRGGRVMLRSLNIWPLRSIWAASLP